LFHGRCSAAASVRPSGLHCGSCGGHYCRHALAIANDACAVHRVRYQDGPVICSPRLHREPDNDAHHPSGDGRVPAMRGCHSPGFAAASRFVDPGRSPVRVASGSGLYL